MMPVAPEKKIAKPPKATAASEWGKKQEPGIVVELPSGNFARVKRTLDLATMLRMGRIPNPLANTLRKMMESGETFKPEDSQDMEMLQQFLDLLDAAMVKCFVEPQVSAPEPHKPGQPIEDWQASLEGWLPEADTVSVFDITLEDKMYVYAVAQGMAADLDSFRKQQEAAMGTMADVTSIPVSSK